LIIGGDDIRFEDVDATFILRIHGMILLICTEPIYNKNKNFILNQKKNKILPISPTKKISSTIFVSSSLNNGNLSKIRPNRSLSPQYSS
jgi:hypothetical protein